MSQPLLLLPVLVAEEAGKVLASSLKEEEELKEHCRDFREELHLGRRLRPQASC